MIFVRKQLSSAQGQHRRIGIIGTVALVQRLGAAVGVVPEPESAIGGTAVGGMLRVSQGHNSKCMAKLAALPHTCMSLPPLMPAGKRYREAMHALQDTFHSCRHRCVQ